jgi:hypothetical protein
MISNQNLPETCCYRFYCNNCDYGTCKKSSYTEHLSTSKHQKSIENNKNLLKTNSEFVCKICEKKYKDNSGLYRHKKKCGITENKQEETQLIKNSSNDQKDNDLMQLVIKENTDFKNLILEVCKNFQCSNITNNNTNNSHNKTFNLQVFLNETCKDAMNIMDFADSIKLQLTDLENVGEYGFVNGISKIIIKSLQEMDVNLRPVHCSDLKREVAYVRENGKWEKDTPDNKLIKKAIKRVAHRNIRQIPEWKKLYPDCGLSDSNKSDQYNELTIEAMGGRGDNDDAKANKIVRKIIQNVVIDKSMLK